MAALGVAPADDPHDVWEAVLCERYEDAFTNAWHDTVISTAHHHCPIIRRGIFHLARIDEPRRTETVSLVAVADDEQSARKLAAEQSSSEGADLWFSDQVTVERIGDADPDSPPHVVIAETY